MDVCSEYLMLVAATTCAGEAGGGGGEVVVCSEYLMLAAKCPPLTPHPPLQPARRRLRCSCSTEFLQAGLPFVASCICYILSCGGHRRTKA